MEVIPSTILCRNLVMLSGEGQLATKPKAQRLFPRTDLTSKQRLQADAIHGLDHAGAG